MPDSLIQEARKAFHASLLANILSQDASGVPSNADRHSRVSVALAKGMIARLGQSGVSARLAGQMMGNQFEVVCQHFLETVYPHLNHLRPGTWHIERGSTRLGIAKCDQYAHLDELARAVEANRELVISLGNDYLIKPDVVILRSPEPDSLINANESLVSLGEARCTSLRQINQGKPLLHASISCKWTLRSDRAQNARSEALNLIRNRKGKLPHIVVVTGEPVPARIASIALGTGDIDCVYHVALPELLEAAEESNFLDAKEMLEMLMEGKRLRDISDLPLDLVV